MANPAFGDEPTGRMTREEYYAWAEQQPRGRFERINGFVVAMAQERIGHNIRKAQAWRALADALLAAGLSHCRALTDGVTIRVDDSDYEPDALVHCGPLDLEALTVDNPVILVEVLSPDSRAKDRGFKFKEYFKLPSVCHYLIVWPDKQQIIHHRRTDDGEIDTVTVVAGNIRLDPPGITISVGDIYQ